MKLTQEEISKVYTQAAEMVAHDMTLNPDSEEFADQLIENPDTKRFISAITAMEKLATGFGLPQAGKTAMLVACAWVGYHLAKAEQAKQETADLERMTK